MVVTHWTSFVEILYCAIKSGNVTFIAVSINTPEKVKIPVAKTASCLFNSLVCILFRHSVQKKRDDFYKNRNRLFIDMFFHIPSVRLNKISVPSIF